MEKLVTEVIKPRGKEQTFTWPLIQKYIDEGYSVKSFQQSFQGTGLDKAIIVTANLIKH